MATILKMAKVPDVEDLLRDLPAPTRANRSPTGPIQPNPT